MEKFYQLTILLLVALMTSLRGCQGQTEGPARATCIPLHQCESLLFLLRNRHNLATFTLVDVYRHLQSQTCGFELNDPKVVCPDVEEDIPDDELDDIVGPRFGSGGIAEFREAEINCRGTLTLIHTDKAATDSVAEMRSMTTVKLTRKRFPDLARRVLKVGRKVLHIETTGNCCWHLFRSKFFKGQAEKIRPGYAGLPGLEPRSVRQVSCSKN